MSLADELLADLEEAGDEGEDGLYPEGEDIDSDGEATHGRTDRGLEDIPEEMEVDYSKAECVTAIAKLRNSKQVIVIPSGNPGRKLCIWPFIHAGFFLQFSDIMDKISDYIGKQRKNSDGECDIHIPRFILHLFQSGQGLSSFTRQFLFSLSLWSSWGWPGIQTHRSSQ